MEISSRVGVAFRLPGWRLPFSGSAVAGGALSFATVTYLALSDGGYDTIPRGQVGIVVWWFVLLAALAGVVPRRVGRAGWLALGLVLGFTAWTGASIGWSLSAERSASELAMVATYAGVFLLALTLQGRAAARHAVYGAGAAVGLIGLLAVLSRLHAAWFPLDPRLTDLGVANRLAYPLQYWNGLAAFLAIGVPLLLAAAGGARRIAVRAVAAAGVPIAVLGIFLADSRGGAIALGVALGAFVLLSPDRLSAIATFVVAGLGSGVLVVYADRHPLVRAGVDTLAARHAGEEMTIVLALVCGGVAMLQVAIGLAGRHASRPSWLEPGPRAQALRIAVVLAAIVGLAIAAGAPGRLDHAWQTFKAPPVASTHAANQPDLFNHLSSAVGNGRYQAWEQAAKANQTSPLSGIGAGTFGLWWSVHATTAFHLNDAHSLYFQTLAETGIVGLVLISGFLISLVLVGCWRALRAPPEVRIPLAGASAAVAAFATSAAYEWVWQLGAIATLALILGAVCVAGGAPPSPAARAASDRRTPPTRRLPATPAAILRRAPVVVVALAALIAILLPLAAARDLGQSRAAAGRGDLRTALADAKAAGRVQPYAASPEVQQALVLEQGGALRAARVAATSAVEREPTNWQPRLILARIESELGLRARALAAFERARRLNPLGAVFNQ